MPRSKTRDATRAEPIEIRAMTPEENARCHRLPRRKTRDATQAEFIEMLDAWMRRYSTDRIKYFREDGSTVQDTIDNRRRRLGLAA